MSSESQLALLLTATAAGIDEAPAPGTTGAGFLARVAETAADTVDQYREADERGKFYADVAEVAVVMPTQVKWQVWTDLRLWQQDFANNLEAPDLETILDATLILITSRIAGWIWDA